MKFEINCAALLSVEFVGLPSVNTHYNKHFRARGIDTAEWRYEAREKAMEQLGFRTLYEPLVKQRALVVVNVFPPYEEISDIHNVHIKPLLDGFSDANVWADDEWAWVPLVMHLWAGIGEQKPRQHKIRRTILDVYELHDITMSSQDKALKLKLPKGRSRNG